MMDPELKTYLEGMEERLIARIDAMAQRLAGGNGERRAKKAGKMIPQMTALHLEALKRVNAERKTGGKPTNMSEEDHRQAFERLKQAGLVKSDEPKER